MAFTDANITDLVTILGIDRVSLTYHLDYHASSIAATDEAKVLELIAEWSGGIGSDTVRIEPKESNYGAKINAGDAQNRIRQQIATLLMIPLSALGFGQMRTMRG